MKKIIFLAALAALTLPASAQKAKKAAKEAKSAKTAEKTTTPPVPSEEEQEARRRATQMHELTPQHHMMMQFAGSWKEEITSWSAPGATPVVANGVRDGRPIMEGRFLSMNSFIMNKEGRVEAQSVLGWDIIKNVYVKVWYDNISPGIMTMEGRMNEANNKIEFVGTVTDPRTKQPVRFRQVVDLTDHRVQVTQIFAEYKGVEYKAMEIKSTRN